MGRTEPALQAYKGPDWFSSQQSLASTQEPGRLEPGPMHVKGRVWQGSGSSKNSSGSGSSDGAASLVELEPF